MLIIFYPRSALVQLLRWKFCSSLKRDETSISKLVWPSSFHKPFPFSCCHHSRYSTSTQRVAGALSPLLPGYHIINFQILHFALSNAKPVMKIHNPPSLVLNLWPIFLLPKLAINESGGGMFVSIHCSVLPVWMYNVLLR